MKNLRDTVEDHIAAFRMKTRSEKIRAIKMLIIQSIVIVGLICSPPIITKLHSTIESQINDHRMPELTTDQKWELVRLGRLHIECVSNTDDVLKRLGMDPASSEGVNYAIDHGLCDFHMD